MYVRACNFSKSTSHLEAPFKWVLGEGEENGLDPQRAHENKELSLKKKEID